MGITRISIKRNDGGNEKSSYKELYKNVKKNKNGWYRLGNFIFKGDDKIINSIKNKKDKKLVHSLWIDLESQKNVNNHLDELNLIFSNPKLESYLQRIIEIASNPGDIILDYHLGSGTTCAVAHKMGRQYIGIEQMDYIEEITCERMKKVIQGEQGGISKSVNWQGGGSFIYTELLEWNQKYIDLLEKAKTNADIEKIRKQIEKEQFYKYQINLDEFDEDEFSELSLKDKKKVLLDVLDLNHLYVNIHSMDDATFKVSEKDKELNRNFYNLEK